MPARAPSTTVEPRLQGSKTDSSPEPPPAVPGKLGVGCLGVVVPLVSGVLLLIPSVEGGSWVVIPPMMLGVHLFLAWATRRTPWSFFTSLGAILLAPLLYLRVRAVLGISDAAVPFINDGCSPYPFFFGDPLSEGLFRIALFIPIAVLGFLLARWIVWRARRPLGRLLHGASFGAIVAGALLFACLLPRALTAPDPEHSFTNFPVLGVVPPAPDNPEPVTKLYANDQIDETSIADLVVSRTCSTDRSTCSISVRLLKEPEDWRTDRRFREMPGACTPPIYTFTVNRASLVVREHAATQLVVFDEGERIHVLRRPGLFRTDVRMYELADSTSPPRSLMVTAAFGIGLALYLKLRRRRLARRLDRIATARAGVLDEAGWIEFEDGSASLRVGPEERLDPGPIVVLEDTPRREDGGPYRGGGRRDKGEIIPGTRATILAREQRALAPLDAHALAVVALAAAPLVAAAQVWLM